MEGAQGLANTDSGDEPTSAQPSELQSSTTLVCAVSVSYQQMVDALSAAPPDTLTQAIEALEDARTRRIQETAESFSHEPTPGRVNSIGARSAFPFGQPCGLERSNAMGE